MEKIRHFNIPVFMPEMACPQSCIYCNQSVVTSVSSIPDSNHVQTIVEAHLKTIPRKTGTIIEIAFFGGNFTGISEDMQKAYLEVASRYKKNNMVDGIRISTRPDFIDAGSLDLLLKYGVTSIELGVQSMDDEVLKRSGRGYVTATVEKAAQLIRSYGFELGMQMMPGLPGDSEDASVATAHAIVRCGASTTRIYPLLVIKDTPLENMYKKGLYKPLTISQAVETTKKLLIIFLKAGVRVLKMGLHPAPDLINQKRLVAGPFHPCFAELVLTSYWADLFSKLTSEPNKQISMTVNPSDINHAIGYKAANKKELLKRFKKVTFKTDDAQKKYHYHVDYSF